MFPLLLLRPPRMSREANERTMPENDLKEDPPNETSTPPGAAFKDDPKGSSGQDVPGKPISDMDPPGQDEPDAGLE
jgi:hypothetical protein